MFQIARTLPIRGLRSTRSTGNLQLRALTSPAAAALKEYPHHNNHRHQQPRQQDSNNYNHQYPRLQNRAVHISTIHHEPFLQTSSSSSLSHLYPPPSLPQPSLSSRPKTSSNVFISSLQRGGIDLTPLGTTAISQVLSQVPYSAITTNWLKTLESAIITSHLNCPTGNHTNPSTGKNLQPSSSKRSWEEWVTYQVDGLVGRFVAMEGWEEVMWNFEYLLMDEGLVVRGDEGVRRIMEVLVRNGWVVAVEEEGEEGCYEVVRPGRVGRFEGEKFAF